MIDEHLPYASMGRDPGCATWATGLDELREPRRAAHRTCPSHPGRALQVLAVFPVVLTSRLFFRLVTSITRRGLHRRFGRRGIFLGVRQRRREPIPSSARARVAGQSANRRAPNRLQAPGTASAGRSGSERCLMKRVVCQRTGIRTRSQKERRSVIPGRRGSRPAPSASCCVSRNHPAPAERVVPSRLPASRPHRSHSKAPTRQSPAVPRAVRATLNWEGRRP
jgi:hypothetical protein